MPTIDKEIRDAGVCVLTLNKPPANAIDEALLSDLNTVLDALGQDSTVRAIVLRGAGGFFCGGFDFAAPRREDSVAVGLYDLYRQAHLKLLTFPGPTIAMMNGHAIAGGLVLVLACDYRLGLDADYKVGLNEVAVGAAFPRTAMEIVRLRLPQARASELILGASLYPASQAIRLGIVDELFPADTFEDSVFRRAKRLAGFPREAYVHSKLSLLGDVVARIQSESMEEAVATMQVWLADESKSARKRQREKLGMRQSTS